MTEKKFNLKKCVWKGIKSILVFLLPVTIAYLNAIGTGEKTVIEILVSAIPILGSLTVAGVLTSLLNWLKNSK